jgi:hypothetical protein
MHRRIIQVIESLEQEGLARTCRRIIGVLRLRLRNNQTNQERFTWIYNTNAWCGSTPSGQGSSLGYTANLRGEIPKLLRDYSIQIIFDAPCGDFNWMRHVLTEVDIQYIGADIVHPLISSLNGKYGDAKTSFIHMDLIKDKFPNADLMICRDCLFHLSFLDIESVLRNFLLSGIPYLLTSTYINRGRFVNRDIRTGEFRLIDLFSSPFNFPTDPLLRIDDWVPPHPERQMCLWSKAQVDGALASFNVALRAHLS